MDPHLDLARESRARLDGRPSRDNNFDSLRLIFAVFVLVGHCFSAARDRSLAFATFGDRHYEMDLSGISGDGLIGFFSISGYLVSGSYISSPSIWAYLWKRVLRIWPAFLAVAFLCVALVGPIGSDNARAYFRDLDVASQLRSLATLHVSHTIAHAFPHNPSHRINGPTWTLPVEFAMYLLVALLGATTLLRRRWPVVVCWAALAVLAVYIARFAPTWADVPRFAQGALHISVPLYVVFLGGALLKLYPVLRRSNVAMACAAICLVGHRYGMADPCDYLVAPAFVVWLAEWRVHLPRTSDDLSYGIYLTAWPVQQLLIAFFSFDAPMLASCTLAISVLLAMLSWRFIERPALQLKDLRAQAEDRQLQQRQDR
jgi:peptidoglycan/LPS O-acetylase OafA/YrhL